MSPLYSERRGGGPRVVLLHGFTQTGRSWDRLAGDLASDHQVVTIDAPGHGGSSDVRATLASAADLVAVVAGRATYIGYSMGGRLALHVALSHRPLVDRLVLLGASAGIDDPDEQAARIASDEALAQSIECDGVEVFLDRWLAQPMFARLPSDDEARRDRLRNDADGLASSLRLAGTGAQESLWPRLGELTMPVTIVAGALDAKFVAIGKQMVTAIGACATFIEVPGAGHAAHLEQPDAFAAIVRAALAR